MSQPYIDDAELFSPDVLGPVATTPAVIVATVMMAEESEKEGGGGAGVAEPPEKTQPKKKTQPKSGSKTKPKRTPPQMMPPWKVLLHNDDINTFEDVILTILDLTPLDETAAAKAALEADADDVSLLLVTHKERAELYVEQFKSRQLTVTIEPAE